MNRRQMERRQLHEENAANYDLALARVSNS